MSASTLERLWRRLQLLVGRGRISIVDDSKSAQVLQVRLGADETADGLPRLADYGFTSNPPLGSDAVVLFIGGERTNGVVIATNNQQFRMRSLAAGETAIYDNQGRSVLLGAHGITVQGNASPITVETTSDITATAGGNMTLHAGGKITLSAPQVEIDATLLTVNGQTQLHGNTSITGDTSITGALTNNGHDAGNTHDHLPGTYHAGGTAITGISGGVTP